MKQPIQAFGYCQCGCGERTGIAQRTHTAQGAFKGQPLRFRVGHRAHTGPSAFWANVEQGEGCWLWQGHIDELSGYGSFGCARAHRLMAESAFGAIPRGLHVCHSCDNPPCVNPAHLFIGTRQDNMDDMARKGRRIEKLSFADVREIRALRSGGWKLEPLADRFNVSISMVSLIALGKSRNAQELEMAHRASNLNPAPSPTGL